MECRLKVGQLFLVQSAEASVGSNPTTPEKRKGEEMLTKRRRKRKSGYETKKTSVTFEGRNEHGRDWVEKRVEEGYLLGWTKKKNERTVYLRYTKQGIPSRTERKTRWKPSRKRTVESRKRWGNRGDHGVYRRATTKGRKTQVEARKEKVGGRVCRWVK